MGRAVWNEIRAEAYKVKKKKKERNQKKKKKWADIPLSVWKD